MGEATQKRKALSVARRQRIFSTVALVVAVVLVAWVPSSQAEKVPDLPAKHPDSFAVMPFENRSGIVGLEWMRVAVPFVLGERAEGLSALRPAYGPYVVPAPTPAHKEGAIEVRAASFAAATNSTWVFTGWIRRPDWKLELGVELYRVKAGTAKRVGQVVQTGEFKDVHLFVGKAIKKLASDASLSSEKDNATLIARESSTDFYAFTIFGRGLWLFLNADSNAKWAKTRSTLERAVHIEPKLTEAHRLLAAAYLQTGTSVRAKSRLEFALKERPEYAAAIETLAQAYRKQNRPELAQEYYERTLQLRPWDVEARYQLGDLYWELGKSDDAFKQQSMISTLYPDHIRARRALVSIHAARKDTKSLVRELQAVVSLAPKDIPTKEELAAALVADGRKVEAIAVYKKITELAPKHVQSMKFIGDLHRQLGQEARAVKYYAMAIETAPRDPRGYFLLGATYVEAGDDEAARRIYLKAQRFGRFRAEAFNNLGAIELRRQRLNRSLWYLRRAVRLKPGEARYRYNLALSLSKTRDTAGALQEVDQALSLLPEDIDSNYLRGVILLREGRAEEARKAFQKTLKLAPSHEEASHNLAMLDELKRRATDGEVVVEGR